MSVNEQLIQHYTDLPKFIGERSHKLRTFIDSLTISKFLMPDGFQIDLKFSKSQLIDIDNHCAPSKAIFMHMTKIEQAIKGWRFRVDCQVSDPLENDKTKKLYLAINDSLIWFKESFVGRLYSEIDTHNVDAGNFAQVNFQKVQISLIQWLDNLNLLAGKDFKLKNSQVNNLPFKANSISNAKIHLQRFEQDNVRKSKASQSLWLAENASQALSEFISKLGKLKTISSLSLSELEEYRALYHCFQPYITKGRLNLSADIAQEIDRKICYALAGNQKNGQPFESDNNADIELFHGLGQLKIFNNKDGIVKELLKIISSDAELQKSKCLFDAVHETPGSVVEFNILELINNSDKLVFTASQLLGFVVKYKSFDVEHPIASSNSNDLFDMLKKLNLIKQDLSFTKAITQSFLNLLSQYNMFNSSSITSDDRVRMNKHLQILQMFYAADNTNIILNEDKTISQSIIEINNYINTSQPMFGSDYYDLLAQINTCIELAFDKNKQQLKRCQDNLKDAYRNELAKEKLNAGAIVIKLRVEPIDEYLKNKTDEAAKGIIFTFDNLSSKISNQIKKTKAKKLYNAQVEVMEEGNYNSYLSEPSDFAIHRFKDENVLDKSPEINGAIYAKIVFQELNNAAKLLLQAKSENHQEFKAKMIKEAETLLKKNLEVEQKLIGFSPKLSILAKQLQDYNCLLKLKLPYSLGDEPIGSNPIEQQPLLIELMAELKLPVHWLAQLESFSIQIDNAQVRFYDLYKIFQNIKKNIENQSVDLQLIKELQTLAPRILATASAFEIKNNLEAGCISETFYNEFKQSYENAIAGSGLEFKDIFKPNYDFNLKNKAKKYLDVAIINQSKVELDNNEQDVNKLKTLLEKLEYLNSFWFTSLPSVNFYFFKVNSHMSEYIVKQREIGQLFQNCHKILDPTETVCPADFLNGKSSFKSDLPLLISTCKKRIIKFEKSIKISTFNLSMIKVVEKKYQNIGRDFLEAKAAKSKVLFESLAEKITQIHYKPLIESDACEQSFITKEQFSRVCIYELKSKAKDLIDAYLKDPAEMRKDGSVLQAQLERVLKKVYEKQKHKLYYYKRLDLVKKCVDEFKIYLKNPEWAIESYSTINLKNSSLDLITVKLSEGDNVIECYGKVKQAITLIENDLLEDISPNSYDFFNYLYYWLMKLCRALKSIITQQSYVNKKDELVAKLKEAVSRPASQVVLSVAQTSIPSLDAAASQAPVLLAVTEQNNGEHGIRKDATVDELANNAEREMNAWQRNSEFPSSFSL